MDGIDSTAEIQTTSGGRGDIFRTAWRKSYAGLAAIGLFSIFINILKLATPLFILQVLDRVISSGSLETLFMLTVITLVAIICGVLLEVVRRRMFMHWGNWIERRFGPALFTAGLKKGKNHESASSKILRDVGTVRSFVAGQGLIAWLDIIWAPIFIAFIFLISPPLAYIVLIGCLLAFILGTFNELITRDSRNATHKAGNEDREWVASAERNRETVGSLSMVNSFARLWSRSASERMDESMRTQTVNVYFSAGMRIVGRFVRIGVLGVGIWLVISQVLTLGSVIAANVLGRTAYTLVRNAMVRWREMVRAKRAYGRMKSLLVQDKVPQVSRYSNSTALPLVLDDVAYRYPNQSRSVLRRINLTLIPGELLCVLGSSASGKTTFCRLASGLIAPRAGKIRLGDVDVYRLQQNSKLREIGYLPQDVTLFQGTVRENIASMAEGDMDQVVVAAKLAGIHQVIVNLPEGYDTVIVDKEPLLSAGQRKSIAIARAFYGAPPVIIMDEPIPHLDRLSQARLLSAIKLLNLKGTIIILTTHKNSLVKNADKVIIFKEKGIDVLDTQEKINELIMPHTRTPPTKDLELVKTDTKKTNNRRRRSSASKKHRSG